MSNIEHLFQNQLFYFLFLRMAIYFQHNHLQNNPGYCNIPPLGHLSFNRI